MAIFYFINWIVAAETIEGGKLLKGGNYSRKYGIQNLRVWHYSIAVKQNMFPALDEPKSDLFSSLLVVLMVKPKMRSALQSKLLRVRACLLKCNQLCSFWKMKMFCHLLISYEFTFTIWTTSVVKPEAASSGWWDDWAWRSGSMIKESTSQWWFLSLLLKSNH
jgi:hypothetical protein